jgi:acylphosphatase
MAAYRYLVSGFVQGVGFRYFVLRRASELGLRGFVRNLPGGAVEVVAEGAGSALAELELALEAGPSTARVESVERSGATPGGAHGFSIR